MGGKKVQLANLLCKGNYAVSGDIDAVKKVMEIAKPEFKARMAVQLAVAGAFHTDFMAPAVDALGEVLDKVEISKPHSDPAVIKEILKTQVTAPVQWETTMTNMVNADFEKGYELGPGKVISGVMKRISKTADIENVD